MSYRLSADAEADLAAIFWHGLESVGAPRTERYLEELEETFALLARFPEAARLRTEIEPAIRAYPKDAHIVLYEFDGEDIVIVRVRSARENWASRPIRDFE